jgi:hypothetical protein
LRARSREKYLLQPATGRRMRHDGLMASAHRAKASGHNGTDPAPAARMATGAATTEPPAPKQGYEPEDELDLGASVSPPGAAEVAESLIEIAGELAGAGVSAARRLLSDALSPLRRP